MAKVIGVRFKNAGKLYYFSPGKLWPEAGSSVLVETEQGLVMGDVITGIMEIEDKELTAPLKAIRSIATEEDKQHQLDNEKKELEAFDICKRKIEEHQLDMKLVRAQLTFDNAKLLFFFTANGRVDFRLLVKDLAYAFHTRIELRQIGVRDEAKMLDGLGSCGRPLCCSHFLGDYQTVSIRMAKNQNLSLNPTKISGVCGRLMCCLTFEEETYEKIRRHMPRIGKEVDTPEGHGIVVDTNVIREEVVVRIHKGDSFEQKAFPMDSVKFQAGGYVPEEMTEDDKLPELENDPVPAKKEMPFKPRHFSKRSEEAPVKPNRKPREATEKAARPQPAPAAETAAPKKKNNWMKAVEDALQADHNKE